MRLVKAITLRLLYGLISLIFISVIVFSIQSISPGDAATLLAGEKATVAQVQVERHALGLDRPWIEQCGTYLWKVAHFDFGNSYFSKKEKVSTIIAQNITMTARIALCAIILASAIGILLGTLAAIYQAKFADRVVLTVSTLGITVPNFVLAPILVYIFCLKLDYLPQIWSDQLVDSEWKYLILPVVILAAAPTAFITRLTRAAMLETLSQEFIKTGIAKGVPPFRLYTKHALRNAILPIITTIGMTFGGLLTGSYVIESYFDLPGIGKKAIEAIQQRDSNVIQGCILVTGAMFIIVNLIVDILLPILDPRIREAKV